MSDLALRSGQRQCSLILAMLTGAFLVLLSSCNSAGSSSAPELAEACPLPLLRSLFLHKLPLQKPQEHTFRLDMTSLVLGYGAYLKGLEFSDDKIYLVTKNDTRIVYDDGKLKEFAEKLENPDLKDMLSLPYSPGTIAARIPENYDPGRFRVMPLLESVYGANEKEVKANLVRVNFCGKSVLFNSQNIAAKALEAVGDELTALFKEKPDLSKYVLPLGGTYNRREIAATERLSPHAFGIAIDLNTKQGAYWQWKKDGQDITAVRLKYPLEIIQTFERNGFIWGGKWAHHDLMHFEYRPELLAKTKLQQDGVFTGSDRF